LVERVSAPYGLSNGLLLRKSPWARSIRGREEFELAGRERMFEVFAALAVAGLAKGAVRETGVKMNDGNRM